MRNTWLVTGVFAGIAGLVMFILGTRARLDGVKARCEVDHYWYFGWWVRCQEGAGCPAGEECRLLLRERGSDHRWADAGVVPGGGVRYSNAMEYMCTCKSPDEPPELNPEM